MAEFTCAMLIDEATMPEVWKSSCPFSSLTPLNCVVLAMRLTLLRIASTWSWLALISSGESAPLLAASLVRLWTSSSSALTSLSAPSAVLITLLARWELSMAWLIPAISLRSVSLAIRAAGASLPALIFSPLASRSRRVERSALLRFRRFIACIDEMFVLIRLMA